MSKVSVELLPQELPEGLSDELVQAVQEQRERLAKRYAGTPLEPELYLGRMSLPGNKSLEVLMGPISGPDHRAVMAMIVNPEQRAAAPAKILGCTVLWFTGYVQSPADPTAPGGLKKLVDRVGGAVAHAYWDLAWAYQEALAGGPDSEGK